jgi:hypothetical protein
VGHWCRGKDGQRKEEKCETGEGVRTGREKRSNGRPVKGKDGQTKEE